MEEDQVEFELPRPCDLGRSLVLQPFGANDPTFRVRGADVYRAQWTPEGEGALHLTALGPTRFRARARGRGRAYLLGRAPAMVGGEDDPTGFEPNDPVLRKVQHRLPGLRLPRMPTVYETFVNMVIQQRVSWREASWSYKQLVRRHGRPFPSDWDLWLSPTPDVIAKLPGEAFHELDIDPQRARALKAGSRSVRRLEEVSSMTFEDADRRLQAFPGVGVWTAQYVLGLARGDADAVPFGDYDLPRLVSVALSGDPHGDDALMGELLEPYRGHRFRVIRLLQESGIKTPRFGPRRPLTRRIRRGR